jgi:hypothetical protein
MSSQCVEPSFTVVVRVTQDVADEDFSLILYDFRCDESSLAKRMLSLERPNVHCGVWDAGMMEEAELRINHKVCFVVATAFKVDGVVLKSTDDSI